MSTKVTHQDARDGASRQGSLAEFLQGSACEDLGESEPADTDDAAGNVAQRDDTRDDLDYSLTVFVSEHGTHYHAMQYGICACPHINGEKIPLGEAVKRGFLPCGVCHPADYRRERPDKQPATVEGPR